MRQIKSILIDNCEKSLEHHYTVNSKGHVIENIGIRRPVKVIDTSIDPDGYNSNSIVIRCKALKDSSCREGLKDLLVELRRHYPEAKILGIKEIGDYIIRVTEEMNQLRSELSDLP
jgi:hypothetical protein